MKRGLSLFFLGASLLLLSGCNSYKYDIFCSVSGVVTDVDDGFPLANVSVTIIPGGNSVQTASDGKFEFSQLTEGQYTISAQKSGYQSNRKNITAVSGETISTHISLAKIPKNSSGEWLSLEPPLDLHLNPNPKYTLPRLCFFR